MQSVTVGGVAYEVRPVKVGMLKRLWPRMERLGSDLGQGLEVMTDFVQASLPGAPDGTADEMSKVELEAAFSSALEVSGLKAKPPGEAPAP